MYTPNVFKWIFIAFSNIYSLSFITILSVLFPVEYPMMADNFEFRKLIEELGLNRDQILELKKAFDSFDCDKKGAICAETTGWRSLT